VAIVTKKKESFKVKSIGWNKLWLVLFSGVALIFLLITIYIASVLGDISNYSFNLLPPSNPENQSLQLEAGAVVNYQDLKSYFLFSNPGKMPFTTWVKNQIEQDNIIPPPPQSNFLEINQAFKLFPLFPNECKNIYCYQHKISFNHIPSIFWKGLIGIEDYRFLQHFGVDFKSIARAFVTDVIQMRMVQGGSTLTQQLAKNLFLTNHRTIERKIREIIYSIYIEQNYPKEKILEAYFNHIYWGAIQGVRAKGIFAASILYFGKRPSEITPYEAAILIAMLKGQNYYHPLRHLDRLRNRTTLVFNKLVSLNLFAGDTSYLWDQTKWEQWQQKLIKRNTQRDIFALWSIQHKELTSQPQAQIPLLNQYERFVLHQAGFHLLQEIKNSGTNKGDFAVKAILGKPFAQHDSLYTFYSKVERDKENAISSEPHQIGSIVKPLVYSIYFDLGKSLSDMVSTEPITLKLLSGEWSPKEGSINTPRISTIAEALQSSYNRPVIRIAQEVEFSQLEDRLLNYIPKLKLPLSQYPAQLLGSVEMSLKEIYLAYSKFLRHECTKAGDSEVKFKNSVISILSDPTKTTIRRKVDRYLKKMSFMGKTGTSNNSHDNWFAFFDGELLGIFWLGVDGKHPKEKIRLSGSSTAFKIFQRWIRDRGKQFSQFRCPQIGTN
jgi:penicillin-binding protein 1B